MSSVLAKRIKKYPRILILSGPSGAGKGTLIKKLLRCVPDVELSISMTTRSPRSGERNGAEYFFVDEKRFKKNIQKNRFLEWARVHGDYYGTPLEFVKKKLSEGKDVLLELDVQGAVNVRKKEKNTCLIFVMPSTFKELERRLVRRKTESRSEISKRLADARKELGCLSFYDYLIYNDTLEEAVKQLECVVTAERLRVREKVKA